MSFECECETLLGRYWNTVFATLSASFIVVTLVKCFGAVWWVRCLALSGSLARAVHSLTRP